MTVCFNPRISTKWSSGTSEASDEFQWLRTWSHALLFPGYPSRKDPTANPPLNWSKVIQLAARHRLQPILHQVFQASACDIPREVLAHFQRAHRRSTHWNLYLTAELLKILARFEAQGIPVLAFKGPIMAQQLYGQLALRQMYDLDLLIQPADAPAAVKLLEAEGFVPQFQLPPARLARYVGLRCELMLWHADKELPVDLHWNPLPLGFSFTPAPELVWDNPATVCVGECAVRTLSPENLLLYLCAHHAKDNWPRLRTVVDLSALLYRFPDLNWDQVRGRAGHFGSVRMLRVGLLLAATLFEPPLPAEISHWMTQDRMAVKLAARILQYLSDDHLPERPPSDAVYRATMDSPRDLAWYWIDRVLLPTPLEWALVDLPDWLYSLYYPIRAGRLLAKHAVGKGKSEIRNPKSENRNQEPKD